MLPSRTRDAPHEPIPQNVREITWLAVDLDIRPSRGDGELEDIQHWSGKWWIVTPGEGIGSLAGCQ